ncbi:rod shape-determining protein MreC [Salinibacter altiplanensis]|uniref:rod shape-determining protein MreC n=1 Tax=Salinibacter altiplanensis TaxID=1803181 RepID=UPI001E4A82CE|nr:rod shape-determining protein MreC [Salinibacter altiplanensis]
MASQNRPTDWLLLSAVLLVAGALMLTQNQPLVRTLRAQAMGWTAQVESTFAWVGRYLRVLERNNELRRENIQLSSQVARTRDVRQRNDELRRLLDLTDTTDAPLRPARIVTKDIFQKENFLILDVGTADGVAEGMPVVHEQGIVGTVVLTNEHYARVMPFLNTDFRVPGTILPLRAEGIVRWGGERLDRLQLDHVVKTEPVEAGQRVVTSGHSSTFPPGRRIGTVDSVAAPTGRSELDISLRPAVPLYEISHAVVILRESPPQQRALQEPSAR